MRSATGAVQSILVLGGASEIAEAIVAQLDRSRLQRVVLAVRSTASVADRVGELRALGVDAIAVPYDALDPASHERVVAAAAAAGDLDLVVVAFGELGAEFDLDRPVSDTIASVTLNGAAACGAVHGAVRTLVAQGHGTLVVLSSVAGQRVRRQNAPYGAGKAALDGFATALSDMVRGSGVRVVVVRPGFVRGRMTAGMPDAPMATTPQRVAADVAAALARSREGIVWSPAALRFVFAGLRAAPGVFWRRVTG